MTKGSKSGGESTAGKKVAIVVIVLGVLGIGAGVAFAMKKPKITSSTTQQKQIPPGGGTPPTVTSHSDGTGSAFVPPSKSSGGNSTGASFPLQMGSNDHGVYGNVSKLQNDLQGLGHSEVVTDGIFGSKTQAALYAETGKYSVANSAALDVIEAMQYPATSSSYNLNDVLGLDTVPVDGTTSGGFWSTITDAFHMP